MYWECPSSERVNVHLKGGYGDFIALKVYLECIMNELCAFLALRHSSQTAPTRYPLKKFTPSPVGEHQNLPKKCPKIDISGGPGAKWSDHKPILGANCSGPLGQPPPTS